MKKSKLIAPLILSALVLGSAVTIVGCGGNDKPNETEKEEKKVVSVTVTGAKTEYVVGEVFSKAGITVTVKYSDGSEETIKNYTVSNTKKLTEADKEIVVSYGGVEYKIPITVRAVAIQDFTLPTVESEIEIGAQFSVAPTAITPENTTIKNFTYSTSDAAILTVSDAGLVKALTPGVATITVKSASKNAEGNQIEKTLSFTVKDVKLRELTIDADDSVLKVGDTKQVGYEVLPNNSGEKRVTFTSSEPTVASISETGLITALTEGKTTITVETVGTNEAGEKLSQSFEVTVLAADAKFAVTFRNADGSLIQYYTTEDLEEGQVPEFTANAPRKAKDSEGVYIFRGFDKEIVPYEASETEIVYTAVYERKAYTATEVTLTMEDDKLVYTLIGESVELPSKVDMRLMHNDNVDHKGWNTSTLEQMGTLKYNADGSFVVKADLFAEENAGIIEGSNSYVGKFRFGDSEDDEDLKLHTRLDMKRYRHSLEGKVIEEKTLANDWDGVTGLENLSQEFQDAIPSPTWDGLGLSFESTKFDIEGRTYELFTDDAHWNNVSFRTYNTPVVGEPTSAKPTSANIEGIEGKPYYVVKGTFEGEDVEADKFFANFGLDFQHNANVDNISWNYLNGSEEEQSGDKEGAKVFHADPLLSEFDAEEKTFTAKILIEDPQLITGDLQVYLAHSWLNGSQSDNMKIVNEGGSVVVGDYKYSIQKDGATWDICALKIEKYDPDAIVKEFKKEQLTLSLEEGVVYLEASGSYSGYTDEEMVAAKYDIQMNSYAMYHGWSPARWDTVSKSETPTSLTLDKDNGKWTFKLAFSTIENITKQFDDSERGTFYTLHLWIADETGNGDMKGAITDASFTVGGFTYSLAIDQDFTWGNPSINVKAATEPLE